MAIERSLRFTFFIFASFSASATFQDAPAFVGYNNLLNAHGIFHADMDSFELASSEQIHDSLIMSNLQMMLNNQTVLKQLYTRYLTTFEKSSSDEGTNIEIFKEKLFQVAAHNLEARSGKHTWEMGVNQFTDMTREHFLAHYTGFNPQKLLAAFRNSSIPEVAPVYNPAAPASINWVSKKKVSTVKDQKNCNSCVMFAMSSLVDSAYAIKYGTIPELSPQELLDCAQPDRDICGTGSFDEPVLNYLKSQGLSTLAKYPLANDSQQKACNKGIRKTAASIASWAQLVESEEALKSAVANGPCTASIIAVSNYGNGIYDSNACTSDNKTNHEVLVVGYGTEKGVDYWLIKNSYGPKWGDSGYFKLRRNSNNVCLIGTASMISVFAA